MTGFRTFELARVALTRGPPPAPVVPMERCRPLAPRPIKRERPSGLPVPVEAVPERQAEPRAPLGLAPVLKSITTRADPLPPVAPILRLVADLTGIPVDHIKGVSRKANVVRARQIACFVAKRFTGRSFPAIGRSLGDRDHTTVLHAVRRAEAVFAGKPRPDEDTAEAWVAYLWGTQWPKSQ